MVAAGRGHVEIIKMLMNKGALINLANDEGNTASIYAVQNRKTEVAKCLVRQGAKVDCINNDGMTALMLADESLRSLLALGMSVDLGSYFPEINSAIRRYCQPDSEYVAKIKRLFSERLTAVKDHVITYSKKTC